MRAALPWSEEGEGLAPLAWCRLTLSSCLPEGLQHLALPQLFLPNETVKEINNLTRLTRLECTGSSWYWPSQDLVGLKVRFRWMPQKQPVACRCDVDENAPQGTLIDC